MTDQNDFIKLLFDTVESAVKDNSASVKDLINQQMNLVNTVERMPISEIRDELKQHVIYAHEERKNILEKIVELSGKVKLMIGVVSAAVVITGIVYVIGRYYFDYSPNQEMTKIEQRIEKQQKYEHDELINAVREEIKKFHPDADKSEKVR
jgi:cell division protein FtsL